MCWLLCWAVWCWCIECAKMIPIRGKRHQANDSVVGGRSFCSVVVGEVESKNCYCLSHMWENIDYIFYPSNEQKFILSPPVLYSLYVDESDMRGRENCFFVQPDNKVCCVRVVRRYALDLREKKLAREIRSFVAPVFAVMGTFLRQWRLPKSPAGAKKLLMHNTLLLTPLKIWPATTLSPCSWISLGIASQEVVFTTIASVGFERQKVILLVIFLPRAYFDSVIKYTQYRWVCNKV